MDSDELLSSAVALGTLWMPPIACACAWWLSFRSSSNITISRRRRDATKIGLILATLSIAFGAFALLYWRHYSRDSTGPPYPTFVTTYAGLVLALVSLPFSLSATSWNRLASVLCSIGLLGFYFMMFLSP